MNEDGSFQHLFEFEQFSWYVCIKDLIDNIKNNANRCPKELEELDLYWVKRKRLSKSVNLINHSFFSESIIFILLNIYYFIH